MGTASRSAAMSGVGGVGDSLLLTQAQVEAAFLVSEKRARPDDPAVTERLGQLGERRAAALAYEEAQIARSQAAREPDERAERAVRGELWARLPEALAQEAYAAGEAVMELERAMQGAQARLAEHQGRSPKRPADVEQWAAQKSALETSIATYGRQLEAARSQAEEIGERLATLAGGELQKMAQNAEAGVQVASLEAASLRDRANRLEQEAKARRAAIGRVLGALSGAGADALYQEPMTATATAEHKRKGGK